MKSVRTTGYFCQPPELEADRLISTLMRREYIFDQAKTVFSPSPYYEEPRVYSAGTDDDPYKPEAFSKNYCRLFPVEAVEEI